MKGIVLNLVEDVVRAEHGDDYWDDVLETAGVTGAYAALGTYPDTDLEAIASTVARAEGLGTADVVRHVGGQGFATFARRYPELVEPYAGTRELLLALNSEVHPAVRRLYPGSVIPELGHRSPEPDVLELVYTSERRRCDLAEGLVLGAAAHYGETVEVTQPECARTGAAACVIRVRFR